MAVPSETGADRRISELRKTEQSATPQSCSRGATQRGALRAVGALARQAADPSGDVGHQLNGAGEAPTTPEGLSDRELDELLDDIVDAAIRLSREQRQIDRRGMGAWRRSVSALGKCLWPRGSKSVRSQDH
jgi:hypothetical protein